MCRGLPISVTTSPSRPLPRSRPVAGPPPGCWAGGPSGAPGAGPAALGRTLRAHRSGPGLPGLGWRALTLPPDGGGWRALNPRIRSGIRIKPGGVSKAFPTLPHSSIMTVPWRVPRANRQPCDNRPFRLYPAVLSAGIRIPFRSLSGRNPKPFRGPAARNRIQARRKGAYGPPRRHGDRPSRPTKKSRPTSPGQFPERRHQTEHRTRTATRAGRGTGRRGQAAAGRRGRRTGAARCNTPTRAAPSHITPGQTRNTAPRCTPAQHRVAPALHLQLQTAPQDGQHLAAADRR